jgi:hypothetical protein
MLKTLYVRRPLKNRADLAAWAKAQGLELQDGAHVTIAFSKNPIKWPREASNPFFVPEAAEQKDGTRSVDVLGEGAIVLRFESTLLQDRFAQLRGLGASWDYDDYQPHITICYAPDSSIDVGDINPYLGPLVFGPEVFAEVKLKPAIAMDEAFDILMAEIQAQTSPALAFDRAPAGSWLDEGLLDRHGVVAELAFDRDLNEGRTTDGFERMHVKRAPITKAGVNPYYGREIPKGKELGLLPDKVYRLLRHPDEIKKGMATSHNVPLLDQHVPHSADEHDGDITVGTVGSNAEYVHPVLYNSLAIWSRDGIDHVESKKQKELSSAYGYDADMTPGNYEGEPYDGVMRNMKWNHVCLVKKGRAGSDIALDEELQPPNQETTTMKLKSMKATVAYGALTAHLRPKLAMDSAIPNVGAALGTFEPGKFKESIPAFITALRKVLAGPKIKLAQDADLAGVVDGVQKLMASIDGDKTVEDEATVDPALVEGEGDDRNEGTTMDGGMEAVKAYLAEKGVPEDIIAGMPGGEAKKPPVDPGAGTTEDGDPNEEDDGDGKKEKPFDKGAMDRALKKVETDTIARMQAIGAAKDKVRPVVGELAGMAFDSAEGVFQHALKMQGKDMSKVTDLAALTQVWDALPRPGAKPPRDAIAQDSAAAGDYATMFPHAAKVRRA